MPRPWSAKRERQFEHIKESYRERGRPAEKAEELPARTGQPRPPPGRRDEGREGAEGRMTRGPPGVSGAAASTRSGRPSMSAAHTPGRECVHREPSSVARMRVLIATLIDHWFDAAILPEPPGPPGERLAG